MSLTLHPPAPGEIVYPESDGKPMADNTIQFRWIVTIKEGLEALFRDDPNVFVAGDLLWYPVRGRPDICAAPDAMVVFGRPKGDRGSYRQWEEAGIAPQVVFEVLSPNNTPAEMARKLEFYEEHGVEEYYFYDPYLGTCVGWVRTGSRLCEIAEISGWTSPRLRVRFEVREDGLHLYEPGGERFLTFTQLYADRESERERADRAQERADQAQERADQLAAKLRALGIDPEVELKAAGADLSASANSQPL